MIILFVLLVAALIVLAAVEVPTGTLGAYERARRIRAGKKDTIEVERELYHDDLVSLIYAIRALLLALSTIIALATFDWALGSIVALVVALEYGFVSRMSLARRFAARAYEKTERHLFHAVEHYPKVFSAIRVFIPEAPQLQLHSKDELTHIVKSSTALTANEAKLITNSLRFSEVLVREVMTPRAVIDAVNSSELLGPLVLDELHKKGHSRYPVTENDIDHVVGILHLRDVLAVDGTKKHTLKVTSAMEARVLYIHEEQTLAHALDAFLKTHHHLFIVVNEFRETVGLLTLEDAIEALLGRKIVDEFDAHDDLRVVAARNPRANNTFQNSQDV